MLDEVKAEEVTQAAVKEENVEEVQKVDVSQVAVKEEKVEDVPILSLIHI